MDITFTHIQFIRYPRALHLDLAIDQLSHFPVRYFVVCCILKTEECHGLLLFSVVVTLILGGEF